MNTTALVMTGRQHSDLRSYLFPGDGLEAAAILLCNRGTGLRSQRLLVAEQLHLPHDRSVRQHSRVSWPFSDHLPPERVTGIDRNGQSIVTIHSHPKGQAAFSALDDENDRALFPSVCNWFDDGRVNGSAIMLPDGRTVGRTVDDQGRFVTMATVAVVGDDIRLWKSQEPVHEKADAFEDKLVQTFGSGTSALLRAMRVGVVGCSGTGSIVIELLARNGIGELVLVDDDVVEEKNLNRIVNASREDALHRQPKVAAMKEAVERMGTGCRLDGRQGQTGSAEVMAALVDCDVIFGCVDTAFGRYHLECLASAHLIPYFDVGVYLEADGEGGIQAADAVSHYVHPEGTSLLARGAYTMAQVAAEHARRHDPEHYRRQRAAGYLAAVGEEQPAVMSVNMQAACMAFNDFLARIHACRFDSNRDFATQRFRLVHGCYENSPDKACPHPLLKPYIGTGDRSVLVRNNIHRD